jgi:PAS domain S-box-containing protein
MPDAPQEPQPHRERLDNPGWRDGGFAMTTSVFGQGSEGDAPRQLGRMAGVIERVSSATFMLDGSGVIREFRLNAEELLGWQRTDMLGRPFHAMFRPEDRPIADAMIEAIQAGDDARGALDAVTSDGAALAVDVHLMGLRDGDGHVLVFGYANDAEDLIRIARDRAVLDSLFEQFPVGVVVYDEEGRFIRLNRALEQINGVPVAEHIGKRIREVLPGLDPRLEEIPDEVLRTGIPVVDEQYGGFTPASDEERVWSVSYNRLHGPDGEVIGLSGLILDVTDRHRVAAAAAGARRRLALVNKAGSRMGTALDVERTARELADVAVPDFADAIVIEIKEEVFDERIGPVGPVWLAPVRRRRVLVHEGVGPVSDPERAEGFSAWSTDADISDRMLGGAAWHSSAGISAVAKEPIRSVDGTLLWQPSGGDSILVPLWAREALLGVVHFHRNPDSPPFEPEDIEVAEEITTRAAVSIDNGRLYYRERTTALMLQRALLPQRIPSLPGVQVAYRYLPGSVGAEVGGDWFDVIQLSGARVALVVGDVMGVGVRAAGIMGQFRTAARTLAGLDLAPAQVLHQLDELGASLSENHLATCIYAVYDPATGKLAVSRAGHPPPLLLAPDGTVGGLDVPPSPPLGVGGGAYRSWVFETKEFDIPDRSRLAFYTDGMVEDKGRDIDEGIGVMAALLANCPPDSLEECCDAVTDVLGITGDTSDDATLLLAQVQSIPPDRKAHWQLDAHPSAVSDARRKVRTKLVDWNMSALTDTAELLVSELVTNAQRYGRSPVSLDMLKTDRLLVEVGDALDVVPQVRRAQETDEGGRGLQLVNQLATRWGTRTTGNGKIVWFELANGDVALGPR